MSNMKKLAIYICCLALSAGFCGCTDEDYKVYDTSQKDGVFFEYKNSKDEVTTELEYSFDYDLATVHTVELPVVLMGMPRDYDRDILLEPVKEETTMEEGVHYTIEDAVLPTGKITANIKINLLRNAPLLQEQTFHLKLRLLENDDLRSIGENVFSITYSDIRPSERPDWWPASSTSNSPLPSYTFEAAQYFFDYFYRLVPEANLDMFNEMIDAYGDYFINAQGSGGPFAWYNNFLKKYVLIPMYGDLKDVLDWPVVPSL